VPYTCRSLKIVKHTNARFQNEIKHLKKNFRRNKNGNLKF